jgi:hypothetical protein
MQTKIPPTITITGEGAKTLMALFGYTIDAEGISEDIDELLEKTFWALSSDGYTAENKDFREYYYRFARLRYAKRILGIVYEAVQKEKNSQSKNQQHDIV